MSKFHWTELEPVQRRIREKITGVDDRDLLSYTIRKYFSGRGGQLDFCITLGSGTGAFEAGLAQYFRPARHLGLEPSAEHVAAARKAAAGLPHVEYQQADLNDCKLPEGQADLILAMDTIHRVGQLEHLFSEVRNALKPNGIFVFQSFLGPSRLQWPERQMQAVNALLQVLPDRRKIDLRSAAPRRAIRRPDRAELDASDPTLAVRSSEILTVAKQHLQFLEYLPYGGTLLHPLLDSIAGNFEDPEGQRWLQVLFQAEDLLLPELGSDFGAGICARPEGKW